MGGAIIWILLGWLIVFALGPLNVLFWFKDQSTAFAMMPALLAALYASYFVVMCGASCMSILRMSHRWWVCCAATLLIFHTLCGVMGIMSLPRSEEHTSELQS